MAVAIDQSAVSRCISAVSKAIAAKLLQRYCAFPRTEEELAHIKKRFAAMSGIPGCIGAIDCTHIAIIAPSAPTYREAVYVNRKGYRSLNVQMVCDADLFITSVNARYPGSSHDSFIWRKSALHDLLHGGHVSLGEGGWLLGDSGYPLEPWILTPILGDEPELEAEWVDLYNRVQATARGTIERCFGVLKSRFRCLLRLRALHYNPTAAANIIYACAVLHNICKLYGLPDPDVLSLTTEEDSSELYRAPSRHPQVARTDLRANGAMIRQSILLRLVEQRLQ
ncbi:putative nuclease HARBI1 [Ornithodoros turicata]|uniref:putative nuclease HARBI1 n=1 Tax=Ornithodoros turicata TaxID=34597 RepID=UPI00313A42F5